MKHVTICKFPCFWIVWWACLVTKCCIFCSPSNKFLLLLVSIRFNRTLAFIFFFLLSARAFDRNRQVNLRFIRYLYCLMIFGAVVRMACCCQTMIFRNFLFISDRLHMWKTFQMQRTNLQKKSEPKMYMREITNHEQRHSHTYTKKKNTKFYWWCDIHINCVFVVSFLPFFQNLIISIWLQTSINTSILFSFSRAFFLSFSLFCRPLFYWHTWIVFTAANDSFKVSEQTDDFGAVRFSFYLIFIIEIHWM